MKIHEADIEKFITKFIRKELYKFNIKKAIFGLSGGLDSTVTAFLASLALGVDNVTGLIMPYGNLFQKEVEEAEDVAHTLGIHSETIDISPSVDAFYSHYPTKKRVLIGNKMARERMSILYDFSARQNALILGTSNKTELLIGYGTIHGDMACAINPIGDLYKTQVRQLGRHLGVPANILTKTPTAGLWDGQTDEDDLGLSYNEIDKILLQLIDKKKSRDELISSGFAKKKVDKIINMIKNSEFKRRMPPIAKLSELTAGNDILYPYDQDK
jgi:NAD+ synthase